MRIADLRRVNAVAAAVHPAFPEDAAIFAERLRLYPQGCHVLADGDAIAGYVVSHPWRGAPPALNTLLKELPHKPSTYYIHDLALLPGARGSGGATDIVATLIAHAQRKDFATLMLIAVNNSERFWRKQGFEAVEANDLRAKLESYGPDARVMRATLSRA